MAYRIIPQDGVVNIEGQMNIGNDPSTPGVLSAAPGQNLELVTTTFGPNTGRLLFNGAVWPTTSGIAGQVLTYGAGGVLSWAPGGGGGGTPGGNNLDIQFNNAGAFGGSDTFQWNDSAQTMFLGNNAHGGNIATAQPNIGLYLYTNDTVFSQIQLQGSLGIIFTTTGEVQTTFQIEQLGGWNLNGTGHGTTGQVLTSAGAAPPVWSTPVTSSPGGADTNIQFNNAGAFGGSNGLTWNGTTTTLTVSGGLTQPGIVSGGGANSLKVTGNGQQLLLTGASVQIATGPGTSWIIDNAGDWQINGNSGTSGQVLTSQGIGFQPVWTTPSTTATTTTNVAGGLANEIVYQTGAGATSFITAPTTASTYLEWNGAGFVWAAVSAGTTTNSITFNSAGTGAVSGTTFNGSTAETISYNTIGAPSVSGTNATGTWGISITGNASTANIASSISGGNTNQIPVQSLTSTTGFIAAPTTASTYLQWNGTTIVWASATATNLTGGAAGDLVYQSAANTTAFVPTGTTGQYLAAAGAAVPTWRTFNFTMQLCNPVGDANTYVMMEYATFPYTINGAYVRTSTGTITANAQINGTSVTGLGTMAMSSTQAHFTATALNSVVVGNRVTVTFSSNLTATMVSVMLDCTRT